MFKKKQKKKTNKPLCKGRALCNIGLITWFSQAEIENCERDINTDKAHGFIKLYFVDKNLSSSMWISNME